MIRGRATLTGSPLSSRLAQWTQPGFVRSVQRGTATILNTFSTVAATITAVDPTWTVVFFVGQTHSALSTVPSNWSCRVALANSTTITPVRTGTSGNLLVSYEVIEFWPGAIRSVQRGNVNTGSTATISAVVTTKTVLVWMGQQMTHAGGGGEEATIQGWLTLTNSTTITASATSTGSSEVAYEAVEYY